MRIQHLVLSCAIAVLAPTTHSAEEASEMTYDSSIRGPLKAHPTNPRYFSDDGKRAVLLTGSHTWNNLVDMGVTDPPAAFDFAKYLDWMEVYPHNFVRLWVWELTTWDTRGNREKEACRHHVAPQIWKRTGPGKALDGKPKFDLDQYDEAYFKRLRDRVKAANERGVYVAVMLFEGWGIQFSPDGWKSHPFHRDNNINDIDGDPDRDGVALDIHALKHAAITKRQKAYVRRVVDTINEFDNVLYEISNENHPASTEWQYEMIRFIKKCEAGKPKQHPVGMTYQHKGGVNKTLFDSPADWISPNREGGYHDNPPVADGAKVIITDTDHLWGIGGNSAWVWKSLLRGHHPIFMDAYDCSVLTLRHDEKWAEPLRKSMGYALEWSRRVDLAAMTPKPGLASTRYCLAKAGEEYLIYLPAATRKVDVTLPAGDYSFVWFDTATGKQQTAKAFSHTKGKRAFPSPFKRDALLYVRVSD